MTAARAAWREHYAQLQACLAQPGWISEGYVQDRGPGAGGPCYQWTRKVKGKTVSVALSKVSAVTQNRPAKVESKPATLSGSHVPPATVIAPCRRQLHFPVLTWGL